MEQGKNRFPGCISGYRYPMRSTGTLNNYPVKWLQEENQKAYVKGAEAEATRAAGLISALNTARKALAGSYDVQSYPGDGSSDCDAAIKEIDEALTKYNNSK